MKWQNTSTTSATSDVVKSAKKFTDRLEKGSQNNDQIALDTKYRKTAITKIDNIYLVQQFDENYNEKDRDLVKSQDFEKNFRWYT